MVVNRGQMQSQLAQTTHSEMLPRQKSNAEKFSAYKKYLQYNGFDACNDEQELKERFKDLTSRDPNLAEQIFSIDASFY